MTSSTENPGEDRQWRIETSSLLNSAELKAREFGTDEESGSKTSEQRRAH